MVTVENFRFRERTRIRSERGEYITVDVHYGFATVNMYRKGFVIIRTFEGNAKIKEPTLAEVSIAIEELRARSDE